jgi:DNA-binding XRE family transcriptional regulator
MRVGPGRPRGVSCLDLIRVGIERAGNQSKLARVIGVTRQTVSSWVKRISRPSERLHRRLARFILLGKRT